MASRVPSFLRCRKPTTLAVQLLNLQEMYPESTGSIDGNVLRWRFDGFKAMEMSGSYLIELEGEEGRVPSVWLSGGAINRTNIKKAPHKYEIDEEGLRIKACLEKGDWEVDQLYTRTFIPWAMEWIVHFEIWCATGEWTGGGIHPASNRKARKTRRSR